MNEMPVKQFKFEINKFEIRPPATLLKKRLWTAVFL